MKSSIIIIRHHITSRKACTDDDDDDEDEEEERIRVAQVHHHHHHQDKLNVKFRVPCRQLMSPRSKPPKALLRVPPLSKLLSTTFKSIYLIILIQLFIISSSPIRSYCDNLNKSNFATGHRRDHYHQQQQQKLPNARARSVSASLSDVAPPNSTSGPDERIDSRQVGEDKSAAAYHARDRVNFAAARSRRHRFRRSDASRPTRSSLADSAGETGPSGDNQIRVAALATKLHHWLKCYRINLLLAQQRQQRLSGASSAGHHQQQQAAVAAGDSRHQITNAGAAGPQEADSSTCPAHFDGHLCWPAARPGEQITLACPQINFVLAPGDANGPNIRLSAAGPSAPAASTNQQQQPLKYVIATIQRQQDSLNGGDINQTQEITSASIQSIKPTGSRAGITTTSINQPGPATTTNGSSHDERAAATPQASGHVASTQGAGEKLFSGTTQHLKFARRTCEISRNSNLTSAQVVQWQTDADYSNCKTTTTANRNLFDPTDEWVALNDGQRDSSWDHRELFNDLSEQLERIEPSIDPYSEQDLLEQWTLCIGEVMRRQSRQESRGDSQKNSTGYCPIIFDGWRCWPATRAGEIAYVNCPKNQPGFSAERKAYKICTLHADWYRHPETNRYWSNYTTCVDTVDLAFRTKILNLYVIGNLISLIALALSLIIFVSFKSLNCTRVTIHKNLFLSFITNNLMWIIWYTYVVNDADLLQSNPIGCRMWHVLLHYFLVSNYFWMFCEGLYLHTLLVVTFVSEDRILKWFYLLGWLSPVPIIVTYAYNRSYDEYYTNFCWMEESPHNVILMAPIGISLLLNLVFLINIVRVLVTKLRANNSPDTHQTRKAVRATLILIPLLGLHYMLTPFRPEAKSEWEVYYEIIAAVCTSFQGLCVAMLFCFCNGEVSKAIKKRLKDSILFKSDNKRGMRSRSNTAISNVFNSVAITSSYTNCQNQSHRRPFETRTTPGSLVSSSSSCSNLISNQLHRQSISANSNKKTPNGHGISADLSNQSGPIVASVIDVSPLGQRRPQSSPSISDRATIETKLTCKAPQRSGELVAEGTIKLPRPIGETNNNATIGGSEASC